MKEIRSWGRRVKNTVYDRGYRVNFKDTTLNHKDYANELASIGIWLAIKEGTWVCTKDIADKEEFKKEFIKITGISEEDVFIDEVYIPLINF